MTTDQMIVEQMRQRLEELRIEMKQLDGKLWTDNLSYKEAVYHKERTTKVRTLIRELESYFFGEDDDGQ